MIEQCLSELREAHVRFLKDMMTSTYRAKETWCVDVRWDLCPKLDLVEVVEFH